MCYALNLEAQLIRPAGQLMMAIYRIFVEYDCSLVEINPLALTEDKGLIALDAKLSFDDNALFRHPELLENRDPEQEDSFEAQAHEYDILLREAGW